MFVLGASSLDDGLASLNIRTRKQLKKTVLAIRGLSLNPFAKNERKTVQFYLNGSLKGQQIVIWHDAVNNSVSKHPSNNNRPLSAPELVEQLLRYRSHILAVVYCQRSGTEDIYTHLKASGILTLHIIRDLISKRKAKDTSLVKKYSALHQLPRLEVKTLTIVRRYSKNLSVLLKKKLRKKLSKRRRRAKRCSQFSEQL